MIVGIGVDVVSLDRFSESIGRTPHLKDRLFTADEIDAAIPSLAATFAAKEALAKALGAPAGLDWLDVDVRHDDLGRPFFETSGTVAAAANELGITHWHLSISHDAGVAIAMVIGESAK
jgi:holo-[acyl-carrier protein] synthase